LLAGLSRCGVNSEKAASNKSENQKPKQRRNWERGYARKQSRQHRTAFRRNSASAVDLRPARLLLAAQRFHRAGHRLASADLQSLGGLGTAWLEMAARLAPLVSAPSGPALAQ
jgi:hypothetical protein